MNPPCNLVLSGGGLKGLSFCGVFKALEEANLRNSIKNVCTVSIGSMMGLLFVLQYSSADIHDMILDKDFSTLIQLRVSHIFSKFGCDKGNNIVQWLHNVLSEKGLHPNITFKQLYDINNISFTVCATNLNTFSPTFFNARLSPNMPVVKAIRMSISIPVLFTPVKFKGHYYIDGSVSNNFPINFFKDDMDNTLAIKIVSSGELEDSNYEINSFSTFLFKCISCMIVNKDKYALADIKSEKTILVRAQAIEKYFLDFNLSSDAKHEIIETGYKYAQEFLANLQNAKSQL
jgi:predicted acylesterase/phospholipase RssA